MFILRIIQEERENGNKPFEQVIENFEIGKSYSVIKKGSSKEFDAILETYGGINKDEIAAILCVEKRYDDNNVFFILETTANRQFSYFVMTESGKTFERL
jgi:hypothetical protein